MPEAQTMRKELGIGGTQAPIESGVVGAHSEGGKTHGEERTQPEGAYQGRKKLPGNRPISFKIPGYKARIFRDGLAGEYRFQVFSPRQFRSLMSVNQIAGKSIGLKITVQ